MIAKPYIASSIAFVLFAGFGQVALCAEETQAELIIQAKVTQSEAQKIALSKVSGGKIKSTELEKEHGKLIWSCDISMPKSKNITEVQVDARSGKIVSTELESPEDQAKEAAAEKKEKK